MADQAPQPAPSGKHPAETTAHLIYAFYVMGLFIPIIALAGVAFAHLKGREDMPEELRTHFPWLIRTFWWPLMLAAVSMLLVFSLIASPLGFVGLVAAGVWYIYRIARGWLLLKDRQPIPAPTALF